MTTFLLLKASCTPATLHTTTTLSDACNRRIGAEALCAAWVAGDPAEDVAHGFKRLVAYDALDATGKACIFQALNQLGAMQHQQQGMRQHKRWWQHLHAQFAEGKHAWGHVQSQLHKADEAATLRQSLAESRSKLRQAHRDIDALRATIDALLVQVRGEVGMQQQLQALLNSLVSAQRENEVWRQEVSRLRAGQARPASVTSLEALLQKPSAASAVSPANARVSMPPFSALLTPMPQLDSPPCYPTTP